MRNYWRDRELANCCGCGACENICPRKCVRLLPNEDGFLYPIKDDSVCIDCGLCEKVCPFSNNYLYKLTNDPAVYAAYDEVDRIGSSSGGVFYSLSRYVINNNGLVYGAAFDEHFQLSHMCANSMSEIQKLRGSKYIQSRIGNCYNEIRNYLLQDRIVMFVGTPCQVAGLRSFLRKDYDNLLLVDLVCHGVPPQKLFDEHVKYLEKKYKATLISYSFRNLSGWGVCEIADFVNPNKHIVRPSYSLSPYLYSFMQAYTYRESCYECKFAQIPRQGDITLADYWGVEKFFPDIDVKNGVSLVLANSSKGEMCLKEAFTKCKVYKSNLNDASQHNANLTIRTKRPEIRSSVFSLIREYGYERIAKTIFRVKNYSFLSIKIFLNDLMQSIIHLK